MTLTMTDVYNRIHLIEKAAKEDGDAEEAHALEDSLWRDVLAQLAASGSPLAALALKTQDIKFPRWCA